MKSYYGCLANGNCHRAGSFKLYPFNRRLILAIVLLFLTINGDFKILAYDFESDGVYYKVLKDSCLAVTCFSWFSANEDAYSGDIKIPDTVQYDGKIYSVSEIDIGAFKNCKRISSLIIPSTINKIGLQAFKDCTGIIKIIIEDGPSTINIADGFDHCPLQEIYLGRNIIGNFKNQSNLTKLTFGTTVTTIGYGCFSGCKALTKIDFPNSITEIGADAFYNCSNLNDIILPNSISTIASGSFEGCSELTNIVIPESVMTIGKRAFSRSALEDVSIPATVREIEGNPFGECPNLKKLIFMDSPNVLKITGWSGCAATFCTNKFETVYLGRDLDSSEPVFMNQGELAELIIGPSVTKIDEYEFYGCVSLKSFDLPNSIVEIGPHAFDGCTTLTSLNIPYSVLKIGLSAFDRCSGLTQVIIANPDIEIDNGAFFGCNELKIIKLGTTTLENGRGKSSRFF